MENKYKPNLVTDPEGNSCLGKHVIIEVIGAKTGTLSDMDGIQAALFQAAEDIGATVLYDYFHPFDGGGVTGALILSESHITIHTWPEFGYAAIDVFVCGKCNPDNGIQAIEQFFQPQRLEGATAFRGQINK